MRITPLQNISQLGQPGTYANGFQKEDAPPPTPDKKMQPEMRNRVEPQSDTRHVVEYFNPSSRMEASAPNRSNTYQPVNIEMGRERRRASGRQSAVDRSREYREILQWFLERQQMYEAREQAYQRFKEESAAPPERPPDEIDRQPELPSGLQASSLRSGDYSLRRSEEAYRQTQHMLREPRFVGEV